MSRKKRFYYYQSGDLKSVLLPPFAAIMGYHYSSKKEAKSNGLRIIVRQMNNLLDNMREQINNRKKLEKVKV